LSVGRLDPLPVKPPRELFSYCRGGADDCVLFDRDCGVPCDSKVLPPFDCPCWPEGGLKVRHPGLED
jgi:hypothetical protein